MLIDIQNTHEGSGFNKVCDFKISTNGIMIKALTSRLYSNPVASIVRELASNAMDACPHTPMQISLPSYLDPQFVIRDFGPGLSRTQMVDVFCHFGESSKRSDNSQIGGFGLGAKSPFALVHSFTITSYNNGTETTYIASIAGDGIPTLNEISSKPTTETGLKICVPSTDSVKFKEALSQIRFLNPRPIVNGEELPPAEIIYQDAATMILSYRSNSKPGVLVGPILYPLDNYKIGISQAHPIILKFNIGEIEVTASREEIVYNRATIETLKNAYQKSIQIYEDQTKLILDSIKDPGEIIKFLNDNPFIHDYMRGSIHYLNYGININTSHVITSHIMKRKKWYFVPNTSNRLWDLGAFVVVADQELKGASKRIQLYLEANPLPPSTHKRWVQIVPDDSQVVEANIPHVKLSDMPVVKVKRAVTYRTLSKNNKFVPALDKADHYIKLDSNMKWCHLTVDYRMANKISDYHNVPIYVLPHDFKGKLDNLIDLTPIHMAAFTSWDATMGEDAASCGGDWDQYEVSKVRHLIYALSKRGILPPTPKTTTVPEIFSPLFTRPSVNWHGKLKVALSKYPLLRVVAHKDGYDTEFNDLIDLILKGN